ncbi:MAG TPA: M55 family metallopeptidase [Mycobacteriales bacterium]|nr:M55 family metallopeptidase [Mycobacteriales bacterium]
MRILISADMEGATGVTWPADVLPGTPQWERFRRPFTSDVNAAVLGFFDGGADEVLINEAHMSMRNLLLEELDPRADMLTGRHKELSMMEGIDSGVDAVAFIGYHAGAGQQGVLAHTYLTNTITGVWLDGDPASEGWLNAALAAEFGVPVILVTGDDECAKDAARYAPHAEAVVVKRCVSRYAAICHPPQRTATDIRAAAAKAIARAGRSADPIARPHRIEIEFDATHPALAASAVPTVERIGDRRIGFDAGTMRAAMLCFKVVTSIAGGSVENEYG